MEFDLASVKETIVRELQRFGATVMQAERWMESHPELFAALGSALAKGSPLAGFLLTQIAAFIAHPEAPTGA